MFERVVYKVNLKIDASNGGIFFLTESGYDGIHATKNGESAVTKVFE